MENVPLNLLQVEKIPLFVLQVVTLTAMLAGLVSLVTTIIPGLTIIWAAALVYALVTGFNWVSGTIFGVITLLMLVGNLADNLVMGANARVFGASWIAIGAAIIGAIVGSFVWPPFGGLVFAFLALFIVEIIRLRSMKKAWGSLRGMMEGCGWAVVIRMLIGVIMILLWIIGALILS